MMLFDNYDVEKLLIILFDKCNVNGIEIVSFF